MTLEQRNKIGLDMQIIDILMIMSEGNPGAISVMTQMLQKMGTTNGLIGGILNLDDMNIRGSQIWVGYKDHCGQDLQLFIKLIKSRDQDMVNHINQASLKGWTGTQHKAIKGGGSYHNGRQPLTQKDDYLLEIKIPLPKKEE